MNRRPIQREQRAPHALTQLEQQRHLLRRAPLVVQQQRSQALPPLRRCVRGNCRVLDAPLPRQLGLRPGWLVGNTI